jgi:class 3 adenylate cyclase
MRSISDIMQLKFEPETEAGFRSDYFDKSLRMVRVALLLALVLYATFGLLDRWIVPESKYLIWLVRYAIVCPILIVIFLLSFLEVFKTIMQPVMALAALVLGIGIVAMIAVSQPGELGYDFYYAGLMLVLMWTYTLSRLRFVMATVVSWLITAAYEVVAIYQQGAFESGRGTTVFLNNNFFFISSNIIGMFASFTIEYYIRKDYLLQQQIKLEQAKSERLLLNVLPASVAETLKKREGTIADAYDSVTVLFADIVGFTELSSRVDAASTVNMLNQIFTLLDHLAEKHGLEKIKTIGDAYMVVGGLPEPHPHHAGKVADFALEAQSELSRFIFKQSGHRLGVRIGINSGPVVAGVIGIRKFTFDLWGDTVNRASRMESHGLENKIQLSGSTFELLRDKYEIEERGQIEIKGIGTTTTYFLKRRIGEPALPQQPDVELLGDDVRTKSPLTGQN